MAKRTFVVKTTMDADSVAVILENFVQSFKDRTVCLRTGEEFVTLKPTGPIGLEMEATVGKGRQKVVIELAWAEPCAPVDSNLLLISSKEPEPLQSGPETPQ